MTSNTKEHQTLVQNIVDVTLFLVLSILQIVSAIVRTLLPWKKQKSIAGDVALVTGGGNGLGRLLALRLAELNAKVIVWDINAKGVEQTVKEIEANGGYAKGYVCDLCKREEVYKVAKKTVEENGEVSILINNAGMVSGKTLLNTPDHLIQRTFDVNILAHFWTTKAFLPAMIAKNSGHIVTIASLAGHVGTSKLVDYCSSKHAAVGFDEALRLELEAHNLTGINTTVICPYFITQTGMFDNVDSRFLPKLTSTQVADRVIKAILHNELHVVVPGYLRFALFLKFVLPWSVLSRFMIALVPDAVPEKPQIQQEQQKIQEVFNSSKVSYVPSSTTNQKLIETNNIQLNHRVQPITA